MREILFRGKRVDNGEWVYGNLLIKSNDTLSDYLYQIVLISMHEEVSPFDFVIPETVGQYTDLTDKNGKKIFEGDIINGYYSKGEKYIENSVVEWSNLFIAWNVNEHVSLFGPGLCYYEVIGNIHDNPELLGTPQNDEVR